MTEQQVKFSIETGSLKLNFWEKFNHYGIVIFLFATPIMFMSFYLKTILEGIPKPFEEFEILFVIVPSILGIFFYKIQKSRLKFKTVNTQLVRNELDSTIAKVANELEWTLHTTGHE